MKSNLGLIKPSAAILGVGSWGTALASVLAKKGQVVQVWDCDGAVLESIATKRQNTKYLPDTLLPEGIRCCNTLEEAIDSVRLIVLTVPSHAFGDILQQIKPLLSEKQGLVCATKGLAKTGAFLNEVAEQVLGSERLYAVLSGPSFAREVAIGLPTAVTIASKNIEYAFEVANYFQSNTFATYTTQDVLGVQLGAIVKNVLAVAVGMSDGLQLGSNARAALITRGLAEMIHLGEELGAHRDTLMGLAGCGDVILTCTDNQSRNRRFGLALAEGLSEAQALEKIGQSVEAVYNVQQLCQLARERGVDLPISEQVFSIMKHGVSPREALTALFSNAPQGE
jgi:glycerol-3-phosphate dehydrogenase (NAD(P)+)